MKFDNAKIIQLFPLILWYFMFGIKILIFWEKRIVSGPIFYMSKRFFWPNHYKKPVFMFMRNYIEILPWEVALKFSFFDLMDLTILDFWQTPTGVQWGQKLIGSSTGTKRNSYPDLPEQSGGTIIVCNKRRVTKNYFWKFRLSEKHKKICEILLMLCTST